jgi:hypothetical protein
MNVDCHPDRKDSVHEVISAISNLYIGITPPEGITTLPPEDLNTRKFCYDILNSLEKGIKSINANKILPENESNKLLKSKKDKNLLKNAIKRLNKSDKPTKIIKKLISEKYLSKNPK